MEQPAAGGLRGAMTAYCAACGETISTQARACPKCGHPTARFVADGERRSWAVTLLLCFFFGGLGVHRFYSGHIGLGFLYLFTVGLCGFGVLVDLLWILTGGYKDARGRVLT